MFLIYDISLGIDIAIVSPNVFIYFTCLLSKTKNVELFRVLCFSLLKPMKKLLTWDFYCSYISCPLPPPDTQLCTDKDFQTATSLLPSSPLQILFLHIYFLPGQNKSWLSLGLHPFCFVFATHYLKLFFGNRKSD